MSRSARRSSSREHFDDLRFDERFDVIFCGSLLTHLPESLARPALRLFDRSLSDRGIAVVTLHGRYSEFAQGHRFRYMEDDARFDIAAKGARTAGFGYVDYDSQAKASFDKQASYGITLVRPHWMTERIEENSSLRLLGYSERDWDNHHDVLVFGKPGVPALHVIRYIETSSPTPAQPAVPVCLRFFPMKAREGPTLLNHVTALAAPRSLSHAAQAATRARPLAIVDQIQREQNLTARRTWRSSTPPDKTRGALTRANGIKISSRCAETHPAAENS
jgi:SAM-dependent methyltransferase